MNKALFFDVGWYVVLDENRNGVPESTLHVH